MAIDRQIPSIQALRVASHPFTNALVTHITSRVGSRNHAFRKLQIACQSTSEIPALRRTNLRTTFHGVNCQTYRKISTRYKVTTRLLSTQSEANSAQGNSSSDRILHGLDIEYAPNPFFQHVEEKHVSLTQLKQRIARGYESLEERDEDFSSEADTAASSPESPQSQVDTELQHLKRIEISKFETFHGKLNDNRLEYLCNKILTVRDEHGCTPALRFLEEVLQNHIITNRASDWQLLKCLYVFSCYHFPPLELRNVRNRFIRSMLQASPPRLEAVSLFFERLNSEQQPSGKHVRTYLDSFCDEVANTETQLAEVEKILQGAEQYSRLPNGDVLFPVVRSAAARGDLDSVWRMISRFHALHHLPLGIRTLIELTKAHARQENWSAIDDLLIELHHRGYSRSSPMAFAALVQNVVQFFARVHQPERTFDFLTYLMQDHGLVPTEHLSIHVLKEFLYVNRFDMVQKWIRERQNRFSEFQSSTRSPLAAYEIGRIWLQFKTSPSDILSACKALAYGTLRDPFGVDFRYTTTAILLSGLRRRINHLAKDSIFRPHLTGLDQVRDLNSMFSFVSSFIDSVRGGLPNTSYFLKVNELAFQVMSARQADLLVNHFSEYVNQHGPVLEVISAKHHAKVATTPVQITSRAQKELPRILAMTGTKLVETIKELYLSSNAGYSNTHDTVLTDIVTFLSRQLRYRDCGMVIEAIWNSNLVRGGPFTSFILTNYLHVARARTSPKLLREALWAAVESDPACKLNDAYLLLVRIAVGDITKEVELKTIKQYWNQREELEYLVSRLYRRRWQQDGCPDVESIGNVYVKQWRKMDLSLSSDRSKNVFRKRLV